jgi:hypothetical protein
MKKFLDCLAVGVLSLLVAGGISHLIIRVIREGDGLVHICAVAIILSVIWAVIRLGELL